MPPIFYKPPLPVNVKAPKGRIVPLQSPQIYLGKSLVSLTAHRISSTALTNIRMALKRYLGKKNEFLVNCHATYPITKKPDGVKMGQGKGSIKDHVARIPAGYVIARIPQISPFMNTNSIYTAFQRVSSMLPMPCQFRSQQNRFPSQSLDKIATLKDQMDLRRNLEWKRRNLTSYE